MTTARMWCLEPLIHHSRCIARSRYFRDGNVWVGRVTGLVRVGAGGGVAGNGGWRMDNEWGR